MVTDPSTHHTDAPNPTPSVSGPDAALPRHGLLDALHRARHDADTARAEAERAQQLAAAAQHEAWLAQRAAERAASVKDEFLAAMSHEIRTPINAQLGYAELLALGLAGPLTTAQRDYVARMVASGRHLLGLVNDLLDLARLDAGDYVLARDVLHTGPIIAAAVDLLRAQAESRGVRLIDEGADDPVGHPVVGDEHRVRQVLVHLLTNAVKFTPAGGHVSIRCTLTATLPAHVTVTSAGPWTAVTVEDTGIGIAPEGHGRIFEAFVQATHEAQSVYTAKPAGSGVGLALGRRLARLMGGDLTLDASAVGVGSTFTLWLPAAVHAAEPRAAHGEGSASPVMRAAEPSSLRIRRLDDLGTILRQHFERVLAAYSERVRTDPVTADAASRLTRAQLEDHQATFLADLAQSLIIVGDPSTSPALAASLMSDGSAIQRTVAEYHGRRRHAQGWTEAAVDRDQCLLREELEQVVHDVLATEGPTAHGTADQALGVLGELLERGRALSRSGWRQAAAEAPAREPG